MSANAWEFLKRPTSGVAAGRVLDSLPNPSASHEDRAASTLKLSHAFGRLPVQSSGVAATPRRDSCPLVSAEAPRACPFGGACHACPVRIQTKPAISQPGDELEKEADRIADLVMKDKRSPRKEHDVRSRPADESRMRQGQVLTRGISGLSGQPLDKTTRDLMEPRLGHNLGDIRIHSDDLSAEISARLNSRAFSLGPDIYFALGQYKPHTDQGRSLLAHELAHTMQQGHDRGRGGFPDLLDGNPMIMRKEETSSTVPDRERVWGFWVTRSMCGCLSQVHRQIEWTKLAIRAFTECDRPSFTAGQEVQDCAFNIMCGGSCPIVGETPASGYLGKPPMPSDPCEKIFWRSIWGVHEEFHARQANRIARRQGSRFWREWQQLQGNPDRLEILRERFPAEVAGFEAVWYSAHDWAQGDIESYTREQQFLSDVAKALERICSH